MSTTIRYVEREGGVYRQYTKESWATRTFVEFDVEDCRTVYDAPSFDFLPSLFFFIIFMDDRPQLWPRFGGANWCRAPMPRETRNKSDILLHLRPREKNSRSLAFQFIDFHVQKYPKKYLKSTNQKYPSKNRGGEQTRSIDTRLSIEQRTVIDGSKFPTIN